MSQYWCVASGRSGDGENIFDLLEEHSRVGIGWARVGDLRSLDANAIRARVHEFYPGSNPQEASAAGILDAFANQIQIGDIVLTRNPYEKLVLIGEVTGDCEFNSEPDHDLLTHSRTVNWLRTDISYHEYTVAFEANGKRPAWGRQTVWNANPHAGEIDQLLEGIGEIDDDAPALVDDSSDDEGGHRFGRERELQDALRTSLHQLEPGLELSRTEQTVPAGRADIVATDKDGSIVVIELKAGRAEPDSITQLLAYMGTIDNPEGKHVRGILVANGFNSRVRHAAKAVPNVDLRSYSYKVSFGDVGSEE